MLHFIALRRFNYFDIVALFFAQPLFLDGEYVLLVACIVIATLVSVALERLASKKGT